MGTSKHLYTIGYEGQTLDAFLHELADRAVRTLVDVREMPLSRKRGFSKRALAVALGERNIAYVHMPALGCPKPVRDRYKRDGNWTRYTRDFIAYLQTQGPAIDELAGLAGDTTACLMCFEADFTRCHRSMVAHAANVAGAPTITHIRTETKLPDSARQAVV